MKSIKSVMGRRQFMLAAGAASTSVLASRKFVAGFGPKTQTGIASASERPATADVKGGSARAYSHLLSPVKIGNVILKNRMIHARSLPHFLQGPETFPTDPVISFYSNVARNGAAVVTCETRGDMMNRKELTGDLAHQVMWDNADPGVQNYLSQLADAIHFYDAKASIALPLNLNAPQGYSISDLTLPNPLVTGYYNPPTGKEIPVELMQNMIDGAVSQVKRYQSLGFDMVNVYMPYRSSILALSLSPALNRRKDKYGGSLENRARFAHELFQAIKKACGRDFLIEAQMSGEEEAGGFTLADVVEYAKIWEGSLDILQLRGPDANFAHPTGFNSRKEHPQTLEYAQAIKESGVKILTAAVGGFQDPSLNEAFIAGGKTDMIAMARAWICDPEYGEKIYEGRGEDVVPCIRCNKCHGTSMTGPWISVCSVNPKLTVAHKVGRMIAPPKASKKVAVIGGGPAGMRAAILAAERGHRVTLYEKNDFLGGQIRYSDFVSFKWPLKEYKDYLIRQVEKAGIEVLLMTKATPDTIKEKGYDAVLVAAGAEPVIPDIPGGTAPHVRSPIFVFGNEKALGKNVVVIGGDEIGVETAIYLAQKGCKATVLAAGKTLAADAAPIHYFEQLQLAWETLDNFSYITETTPTAISTGKVTYTDADGNEKTIPADGVVVSAGRMPRHDEAMKFYGSADRFFIIGDCREVGNVQKSNRSAFAAASSI